MSKTALEILRKKFPLGGLAAASTRDPAAPSTADVPAGEDDANAGATAAAQALFDALDKRDPKAFVDAFRNLSTLAPPEPVGDEPEMPSEPMPEGGGGDVDAVGKGG